MLEKIFKFIGKPTSVTLFNKLKPSVKKMVTAKVQKDYLHYANEIEGDFVNDKCQEEKGFVRYTDVEKYNIEIDNELVTTDTLPLDGYQRIVKELLLVDKSYLKQENLDKISCIPLKYVAKAEKVFNDNIVSNNGFVRYSEGITDRSIKVSKFDKVYTKSNKVKYLHEKLDKNYHVIKKMLDY